MLFLSVLRLSRITQAFYSLHNTYNGDHKKIAHSYQHVIICFLFQLFYEPNLGDFVDDTAVNGMEAVCRGPGMDGARTENIEQKETWGDSEWSYWSSVCPLGQAVCALSTRVESDQGSSWGIDIDDGALSDAHMFCCDY